MTEQQLLASGFKGTYVFAPGQTSSLPGGGSMTFMQEGGFVTRPTLAMLHANEAAIPLNRAAGSRGMGYSHATINVFLDSRLLAQEIATPLVDVLRLRAGLRL